MSFHNKAIILTGATSALGQAIAKQLSKLGTKLALVDRKQDLLKQLQNDIEQQGGEAFIVANDFQAESASQDVITHASALIGEVDILINVVNDLSIRAFEQHQPGQLAQQMYAETIIPMMMCQAVLPGLLSKQSGQIVNVGNLYGALSLAETASTSANTEALIGFSESLAKEYRTDGIRVSFIGARPIKTALLDDLLLRKVKEKNLTVDTPVKTANAVIDAIHHGKKVKYLGQPESVLIWLKHFFPTLGTYLIKQRYQSEQENN